MADDAEYLRTVLPVLTTYTTQVVMAIDLERMRRAAYLAGDINQLAFIDAVIAFRGAVLHLRIDERSTPCSATAATCSPSTSST